MSLVTSSAKLSCAGHGVGSGSRTSLMVRFGSPRSNRLAGERQRAFSLSTTAPGRTTVVYLCEVQRNRSPPADPDEVSGTPRGDWPSNGRRGERCGGAYGTLAPDPL